MAVHPPRDGFRGHPRCSNRQHLFSLALLAIWAPFSLLVTSFATLAGRPRSRCCGLGFNFVRGVADLTGNRDLKAQPGLDLVQEGINELRRVNAAQALLIGASAMLLLTASAITTGSVGWNLAMLLVIVSGVAQGWHAQLPRTRCCNLETPTLCSSPSCPPTTPHNSTAPCPISSSLTSTPIWSSTGGHGATNW